MTSPASATFRQSFTSRYPGQPARENNPIVDLEFPRQHAEISLFGSASHNQQLQPASSRMTGYKSRKIQSIPLVGMKNPVLHEHKIRVRKPEFTADVDRCVWEIPGRLARIPDHGRTADTTPRCARNRWVASAWTMMPFMRRQLQKSIRSIAPGNQRSPKRIAVKFPGRNRPPPSPRACPRTRAASIQPTAAFHPRIRSTFWKRHRNPIQGRSRYQRTVLKNLSR